MPLTVQTQAGLLRHHPAMMHKGQLPVLLLVEDVHELRDSFKHTLRAKGFHVLEARDDNEAIEQAEYERIDLIFTDLQLPTLASLTRRLHDVEALRNVPIVVVDGDEEEGQREDGIIIFNDLNKLHGLVS